MSTILNYGINAKFTYVYQIIVHFMLICSSTPKTCFVGTCRHIYTLDWLLFVAYNLVMFDTEVDICVESTPTKLQVHYIKP